MDAASNVPKRNVLAQHLREVIDCLERKVSLIVYIPTPEGSLGSPSASSNRVIRSLRSTNTCQIKTGASSTQTKPQSQIPTTPKR
jgi:hypothetical protein